MLPSEERSMPRSAAFVRIQREVLDIVSGIPEGRWMTYASIGARLDLMPRRVADILATLSPDDAVTINWHRVVAADGRRSRTHPVRERQQTALLRAEGHTLRPEGRSV